MITCFCDCIYTELAAAIPQTEVVGKGDYFRFGMRDSLAIEASFLQVIPYVLGVFILTLVISLTFVVHLKVTYQNIAFGVFTFALACDTRLCK